MKCDSEGIDELNPNCNAFQEAKSAVPSCCNSKSVLEAFTSAEVHGLWMGSYHRLWSRALAELQYRPTCSEKHTSAESKNIN